MPVVVQFHTQVEDDLDRWLEGREPDDENRRALVRVYVDELIRVLGTTAGQPPGAIRVNSTEPRRYEWVYTGELTVDYEVRTPPRRRFGFGTVRVIVTQIRPRSAE